MENSLGIIEELAALNPCIKFIIDNYDMLCCVYPGKVVMTMNSNKMFVDIAKGPEAYVAKVFDSMVAAMSYTHSMEMGHVPYALIECNGAEISNNISWSIGCKEQD